MENSTLFGSDIFATLGQSGLWNFIEFELPIYAAVAVCALSAARVVSGWAACVVSVFAVPTPDPVNSGPVLSPVA